MLRPRFSLRTLFVLVTALCIFIGSQARVVQHRKSLLETLSQAGGGSNDSSLFGRIGYRIPMCIAADGNVTWIDIPHHNAGPLATIRHWLGDRNIGLIYLSEKLENQRDDFVSAFPEATVIDSRSDVQK